IPPTGRLATRNDGTAPTAVVIVTIAAADRLPAGTAAKARASAEVVLSPGATLAAGRLVLAPGAGLVWSNPPGPLLVLVEAGRVEVATRDDTGPAATWRTLATGDGWATRAGRDGFWQAAPGGSAVLFVVTVATAVSGGAADPPPNAYSAPT
ncbi:MAG: hypothetical protein QOG89_721, partial [Thermomicrobiales bacterium]|nr:hypothetical protein [Thermomicrobiales bacterium]